jgi:hypothetical protein
MERRSFLKNSIGALFFAGINSNKILAGVVETLTPDSPKILLYLIQLKSGEWKIKATKWIDLYKEKRLKACEVNKKTFKALDIVDYEVATKRKLELWKEHKCTGRFTEVNILENIKNGHKALKSQNYIEYRNSERFKQILKKRNDAASEAIKNMDDDLRKLRTENAIKHITGRKHSEETIQLLKQKFKGRPSSMKGKKHSEETKKILSELKKGKPSHHKGKKRSEESRKKMSQSAKVKIFTQQHRDNMSKANSGHKNPFYGKKHTQEALQIMKDKHPSKIKLTCEHCKKEFDLGNYKRSHGDKCKLANIDDYNEKFLLSDRSIEIITLLDNNVKYKDITSITGYSKNTIIKTNKIYKSVFV